jgi:hypothetical protein
LLLSNLISIFLILLSQPLSIKHSINQPTMTAIPPPHPSRPAHLDDEIMALTLQLEEIESNSSSRKGKHRADCPPPDFCVASSVYQAEIQQAIESLTDLKFAHSIARAVDTDAQAIRQIGQEEAQGEEDRRLAL